MKHNGKYSLPAGMFSDNSTLLTSLTHKYSQNISYGSLFPTSPKNQPKTTLASQTYRQKSAKPKLQNSQSLTNSQAHFRTSAKLPKKGDASLLELLGKDLQKIAQEDTLDVSIHLKTNSADNYQGVRSSLMQLKKQIDQTTLGQLNLSLLNRWQRGLMENCDTLIRLSQRDHQQSEQTKIANLLDNESPMSKTFKNQSIFDFKEESQVQSQEVLLKLLAEEKQNRLLVEEQTSVIIQSQEQQIKNLTEKLDQLDEKYRQRFNGN